MVTAQTSLDTQMLAELKDLLAENFDELIDRYTQDSSHRFALLRGAVITWDYKTIYYEAHGVKGSSRNMGANKLAEICGQMEALGHAQNNDGVLQLLAAAEAEFSIVNDILSSYKSGS